MDVVWLILDSVSFDATPFAPKGPNTMPLLSELAGQCGTVFTDCYSPGPASPSSHSSFFTGRFPSETGMHAVNPRYDQKFPTIADATSETHESLLVTTNHFLHRGLDSGFDKAVNVKIDRNLPFRDATNPRTFTYHGSNNIEKYLKFLTQQGKPIQSLVNGLFWKQDWNASPTSAAEVVIEEINNEIRTFRQSQSRDTLVVANYMEAHAPFNPPADAIERFAEDGSAAEHPIGKTGQKTRKQYLTDPSYDAEDMYTLYLASIWDLDRKVTPLIEEMVTNDAMVVVTADHGNWFRIDNELEESRIHVPLIIFTPKTNHEVVSHTVNLRHLAATTTTEVKKNHPSIRQLPGDSLLEVNSDMISVTEFIQEKNEGDLKTHPVDIRNISDDIDRVYFNISAIKGGAKINYYAGSREYESVRGNSHELAELQSIVTEHTEKPVRLGSGSHVQFDDGVESRLRQLGYLD